MINVETKRLYIFSTAVLLALVIFAGAMQKGSAPKPDSHVRQIYQALDPYESTDGSQFWVRVTEHPEEKGPAFIAGSFSFFESGRSETGPWTNIMTVHLDDPDPIPSGNVRFVNNEVAYLFLYDKLAVTVDGGSSWSSWELAQGNAEWRPKRAIIRDVILSGDGSGTMVIEVFASSAEIKLYTHDFGKTWLRQ
jgi:hypothetical protein